MHVETVARRAAEFVEGEQRTRDGKALSQPSASALKISLFFYVSLFLRVVSFNVNKKGRCRRVAVALVTLTEVELHGKS